MVSPLDHVNLHQSTNDTFPTAIKVAGIIGLRRLSEAVARLQGAFQDKEKEFGLIVKIGRTELQEAVPITLGMEFSAFAEAISRDRWRIFKCEERLRVVNIGGTAVGTGLAAPRDYIFLVIEKLRDVTGLGLARGENLPGETANADPFVEISGILKAHASNLAKIANDLRLLNLLGEIKVPGLQAGSSIMPGKINPVIMEAAIQAAIKAMANDFIITEAASRGTLQLSEFLPVLADALLESLELLCQHERCHGPGGGRDRGGRGQMPRLLRREPHDNSGPPAIDRLRKSRGAAQRIQEIRQKGHEGFPGRKTGTGEDREGIRTLQLNGIGIQR